VAFVVVVLGAGAITWVILYSGNGKNTPDRNQVRLRPAPQNPDWLQDFATAKQQATEEKKDILLLFEGSDWHVGCQGMERAVFAVAEFQAKAGQRFVLVKVDFPREAPARARVKDPVANDELQKQFGVTGYPFVVLTDSSGNEYAHINGFLAGGYVPFLGVLDKLEKFASSAINSWPLWISAKVPRNSPPRRKPSTS